MTNETYKKKISSILYDDIVNPEIREALVDQIINQTNLMKEDIAEAIKKKAQSGGGVDFIAVPQAIEIIANGGIPTEKEILDLIQEYMNDGDLEAANDLLDALKRSKE